MKRFIITNLLAIMALPMLACAWIDNHNYYLFSVCGQTDFQTRVEDICDNNWKVYLGMKEDDWFYFNSQKENIIKTARQKGDNLMISYIENLEKYLDCAREVSREAWDYPTKEQLAKRKQTLTAVRTYAQSKLKTVLRSQHGLLFMRCNMLLGRHQENISFWEQTASQYIETVYKDMMKNIYAGALYKTGNGVKAGELFAEMGDYNSLMTQYYKKRSFAAIRQEYLSNPNSKVLPFLLQDFVNNAQEAYDQDGYGKLFVRDISKAEATQMINFCGKVIEEGKTETPALWQSAKAWLKYMFGNRQQALDDITKAGLMKGTQRMEDNARVLRIFIASAESPKNNDFDNWLELELGWLDKKTKEDDFFQRAKDRLTHQILIKRYADRPETAIALLNSSQSYQYQEYIDTMKVEGLEKYFFYTLKSKVNSGLDRYLKTRLEKNEYALEDLIGTKYMRLCQWDKAITWLKDIPVSYYEKKGYAVYAANRRYNLGPWIKRQWLTSAELYSDTPWKLDENPKLAFAKEMLKMEGDLNILSGEALKKQYYELAVRYAQASYTGDCWFLMRDGKSVIDTVRVNEVDLAAKAASLLKKAGDPHDFLLKEKVLFARAYCYMNPSPWYTEVWNNETYEYDRHPDPNSTSYKAFAVLAEFEKQHADDTSGYVSNCDEYDLFLKAYNQ